MAGEKPLARAARRSELVSFLTRKLLMLRAVDEFEDGFVAKIAESILRKNEVVAAVNIAVGFYDSGVAAFAGHGAQTGGNAKPVGKCRIKKLNEDTPYVVLYPFIKYGAAEVAPFLRTDREGCQLGLLVVGRGEA